ncbi:MAG: sialate O-acetylesterase [Lachnospiraceae bacterium]|nr:sialate O-acetylesterase [Lachnospiraceae bacterium]
MLQVSQMYTSHMVLQRECKNCIWGMDDAGEKITVFFQSDVYTTVTDDNGTWKIILNEYECGGPFRMLIQGSSRIELTDILIGDVYLLAGQSNMELRMMDIMDEKTPSDWDEEDEQIRYYRVEPQYYFGKPAKSIQSDGWKQAIREQIKLFSAAGLYCAREIRAHQNIPIGLVNIAVGGSTIEAWMPSEALLSFGNYMEIVQPFREDGALEKTIQKQTLAKNNWEKALLEDTRPVFENRAEYCVPNMITTYYPEGYNGSFWLEKTFELEEAPKEDGFLDLGLIIDKDYVWINDTYIGMSEHRYCMRQYTVPKQILKQGLNKIRIKIIIENQNGGIVPDKEYFLSVGKKKISLAGAWQYCEGIKKEQEAPPVLFPPLLPMGLFYGALMPIKNLQFRAVLWYQGESNVGHEEDYCELFHAMKKSWEAVFERTLRFCCVQLAGYQDPMHGKKDTGWGMIREYQRRCTFYPQPVYNGSGGMEAECGLITANDIGEHFDLHPHNKKEVGKRLALWVRHFIYEEEIEYRGPVCVGYEKEKDKLILHFTHDDAETLLLSGFEISYNNTIFYPVDAKHEKGKVVIDLNEKPDSCVKAVRYAWYDYPERVNFYNQSGIPAESFLLEI